MQKPGPRGRSSSINPGPRAAVECKTPRGGCWCFELTDALLNDKNPIHGRETASIFFYLVQSFESDLGTFPKLQRFQKTQGMV